VGETQVAESGKEEQKAVMAGMVEQSEQGELKLAVIAV
jgi:hypothetical protein